METEVSWPYSQESATGNYPEPDESSPYCTHLPVRYILMWSKIT